MRSDVRICDVITYAVWRDLIRDNWMRCDVMRCVDMLRVDLL